MTRKLGILILSSLAAAASHPAPAATPNLARQAESQSAKPAAPAKEMRVAPEPRKLSPEVIAQHQKLQRLLPAETKLRIDRLVPDFKKQVLHAKPGTDLRALAVAPIRREFTKASPQQTAALVFELIAVSLNASNNPVSDMSTQDQMNLQQLMEQKSQFEEIFSNLMKTFQDTQDSIIQNIK
jgi:hypothetical protein